MPPKKSTKPHTTKSPPQPTLNSILNSAWSKVNFGQLKTWKELFEFLGLEVPNEFSSAEKLGSKPTYGEYKQVTEELVYKTKLREILGGIDVDKLDSVYNAKDFEIESLIDEGGEPNKELALIPPIDANTSNLPVLRPAKVTIDELVAPYWPPESPEQRCTTKYFQEEAAKWLFYETVVEHHTAQLLRANTGDGKTYALGRYLRKLFDAQYFTPQRTLSPFPVLYVTAASVVEQTTRCLRDDFGLPMQCIIVTNYDALRSRMGEMFIEETEIVEFGEIHTIYRWKPMMFPCVVIWDECQKLKNEDSDQSKIGQAYSEIPNYPDYNPQRLFTTQIFSSATPFSKVASAKCFCVATRIPIQHGIGTKELPLTNKTWPDWSRSIAYPADPHMFSKASIKRLLKVMSPWITGFKNVRKKHHGFTRANIVDFETPAKQQAYVVAWETFLDQKRRLEGDIGIANARFLVLVQLQVFQRAAEMIKTDLLAEQLHKDWLQGFAPAMACKFKPTIAKVVWLLHTKYGISRNKISLIWGGSAEFEQDEDDKYTTTEIQEILLRAAKGYDVDPREIKAIHRQLKTSNAGLKDLPSDLRLGIQSRRERQREIDRFQSGRSEICLFTFGAGGAGLSLHHAFEHTRPRRGHFAVTWNEMEMAQATGRLPRLTSLSDTEQLIWAYRGTIEVTVLAKLNLKTGCLAEVIKHSETNEPAMGRVVDSVLELSGSKTTKMLSGNGGEEDTEDAEDLEAEAVYREFEQETEQQENTTTI